jgi:hypothetical protein
VCAELLKTMYGSLDAAARWAAHYSEVLRGAGYAQDKASPCHFFHPGLGGYLLVHGDDFFNVGARDHLLKTLKAEYDPTTETIGPEEGDVKEMKILGRIVSYHPWGIQYEPDPNHAETVIKALGLTDCKEVSIP